jgi:predicted PurR-regulated permease PerM
MADTEAQPADVLPTTDEGAPAPLRLPPWRWILRVLLMVVAVGFASILFYNVIRRLLPLIVLLVTSLFLSFALEPAVSYLSRRGMRRGVATFLMMLAVALVGVALLVLLVPVFVDQLVSLVQHGPEILAAVTRYAREWFGLDVSAESLQDTLNNANTSLTTFSANIAGNVFGVGAALVAAIFRLLTIALFTFYLVADGPRFRRTLCSLLPPKQQRTVLETWEVAIDKTGAYLYSRVVLAVISGVGTYVVLRLLSVPYALPLSFWMGLVSQFIPTVGTYIAMALPLLVALVQGPTDALILLVYFSAYQQIENYVISPRVTSRTMAIHPALAFGAAIAGASISGVVGALLALPAAAIVQAVGSTYVHRHEVMETKLTMPESEAEGPPPPPKQHLRSLVQRWRSSDRSSVD